MNQLFRLKLTVVLASLAALSAAAGCSSNSQETPDASQPCTPGATTCPNPGTEERAVCDDQGVWQPDDPCTGGKICLQIDDSTSCGKQVCNPSEVSCSEDFTAIVACDATGTKATTTACAATEVCIDAVCQTSAITLGDIVEITSSSKDFTLSPGYYAATVIDTNTTGDGSNKLTYPLALTGAITDPVLRILPPAPPSAAQTSLRCGTPAMKARLARHPYAPRIKTPAPPFPNNPALNSTYTFKYPDEASQSIINITGKLCAIGQVANFWEDTTSTGGCFMNQSVLSDIKNRLDTGVVPRDIAIFGTPSDVDGNGKIDILFTTRLPDQGSAAFVMPYSTLCDSSGNFDHGEAVYSMPPDSATGTDAAQLATILAHEIAHLISAARMNCTGGTCSSSACNNWRDVEVYVGEGLSNVAIDWSGQYCDTNTAGALAYLDEISLERFLSPQYIQESIPNAVTYGTGTLVMEYLFDQAGAVSISGAATVIDHGGKGYLTNVFTRQATELQRLAPSDGRTPRQWYSDLATALLLTTVAKGQSATTIANKKYHYVTTTADPAFGGFDGPALMRQWCYGGTGPFIEPTIWSKRAAKLREGGMGFTRFAVGADGATARVTGSSSVVRLIRYQK